MSDNESALLDELARDLTRSPILVVTGAGISLASGIPTFRGTDAGAIWSVDVTTLGTRAYFERDPAGSWAWYLKRFGALEGKEPNPAHRALVALERLSAAAGREYLLVTQNVDTLHEMAGSKAMVKVHGTADRIRCSRGGCANGSPSGSLPRSDFDIKAFLNDPVEANVPRCPACGSMLRQHVLWFDEYYTEHADYQFTRVQKAMKSCQVVLFVGTSFAVGLTDNVLSMCAGRVPVWSIDPSGRAPDRRVRVLAGKAEEALPEVVVKMGGEMA
ncbi:NAD-dependent protein deacetylase of SIR2 family protein [Minicystis rosea]|nr:NAD-dependent protein deacetylase of SIR2 family protein [Minicystis rosea]